MATRVARNVGVAVIALTFATAPVSAAAPIEETIWTSHGVSLFTYNPCDSGEFVAASWYIELDTVRRYTNSGDVVIRAVMEPLAGQWHWYGWRTTDPEFDPTVPHAGDPDYVYTLAGSSRARASIEPLPGATLLEGELAVSGEGPSAGLTIHYVVEHSHIESISAEVTAVSAECPDGTLIPLTFTYFP